MSRPCILTKRVDPESGISYICGTPSHPGWKICVWCINTMAENGAHVEEIEEMYGNRGEPPYKYAAEAKDDYNGEKYGVIITHRVVDGAGAAVGSFSTDVMARYVCRLMNGDADAKAKK